MVDGWEVEVEVKVEVEVGGEVKSDKWEVKNGKWLLAFSL
jgi:hypothetical protein